MRAKLKPTFQALLFVLVLMLGTTVLAQTSAGFNLEWHVIGSGGGESSSAGYQVKGTIGQSIASQPASGSANFTVSSGYWFGDTGPAGTTGTGIYLPIIFKN
ncbi:MAG TPA: hypothetical protein VGD99_28885 [Anaerolineae bacterium]